MFDEPEKSYIDDEPKEYYIEEAEKYNKISKIANITMVIGILRASIKALRLLLDNLVTHDILPEIFQNTEISQSAVAVTILAIISASATKGYSKDSITEIRDMFAQHGLVLEDELENSKGRGK